MLNTTFFVGLTTEQIFVLGKLAVAFSERKRARERIKVTDIAKKEAEKKHNELRYRTEWEASADYSELSAALHIHGTAMAEKASKEKHFKKIRYEFLEAGGSEEKLNQFVELLTKEIA